MVRKVSRKGRLSLRKDILKAVVLITSKDHYRTADALGKILSGLRKPGDYTFDCETVTPRSGLLPAALERAQMLPMGAERRVLVITEAQDLTKEQAALLEAYLERSVSTTSLILAGDGVKKDGRAWKLADRYGDVLVLEEYGKNEFPALIREAFGDRGKRVTDRAVGYMRENLGQDLGSLYAAIEKIDLYHEGRNEIDLEDVVPFVAPSAERSVFELIDQLSIRDLNHSLKVKEAMLKQGEDEARLLHMLVWQFRRLIYYKALRREGRDDQEILKYLEIKPFVLERLKRQSKHFSMEELKGIHDRLLLYDVGSKTSSTPDPHHLDLLIYDICGCHAAWS